MRGGRRIHRGNEEKAGVGADQAQRLGYPDVQDQAEERYYRRHIAKIPVHPPEDWQFSLPAIPFVGLMQVYYQLRALVLVAAMYLCLQTSSLELVEQYNIHLKVLAYTLSALSLLSCIFDERSAVLEAQLRSFVDSSKLAAAARLARVPGFAVSVASLRYSSSSIIPGQTPARLAERTLKRYWNVLDGSALALVRAGSQAVFESASVAMLSQLFHSGRADTSVYFCMLSIGALWSILRSPLFFNVFQHRYIDGSSVMRVYPSADRSLNFSFDYYQKAGVLPLLAVPRGIRTQYGKSVLFDGVGSAWERKFPYQGTKVYDLLDRSLDDLVLAPCSMDLAWRYQYTLALLGRRVNVSASDDQAYNGAVTTGSIQLDAVNPTAPTWAALLSVPALLLQYGAHVWAPLLMLRYMQHLSHSSADAGDALFWPSFVVIHLHYVLAEVINPDLYRKHQLHAQNHRRRWQFWAQAALKTPQIGVVSLLQCCCA